VHRPRRLAVLVLALALSGLARAGDPPQLRVCADPDNLPFSNSSGEGFENKIADVVASDLGMTLSYFWWPHQRGLVRRTLAEDRCDVLIGVPHDLGPILPTRAYYRSSYVVVSRPPLAIASLDDPALRRLRIGVHVDTPPWNALGERGLMATVEGYPLMFDYRNSDPSRRPAKPLEDLEAGTLDVAIVWGPLAGWFAKQRGLPLSIAPLPDSGRTAMGFDIAMGVRKSDAALKARLESALDHRAADIAKILADYGVPVVSSQRSNP
jgi:mxaJ protein